MKSKVYFTLGIIVIVLAAGIFFSQMMPGMNVSSEDYDQDFEGGKITLADLEWGCPREDCIPSIDEPRFESMQEGDEWMEDDDLVFGLSHMGEVRAYPQRILNWHEIVNDVVGEDPIAITFCPLCGSAIAFERKVGGNEVEFGVSGRLYNSNLVMYDRSDEKNFWQQATGEAIIGPAVERKESLARIPIAPVTWGEWKKEHPETLVLSRDTGFFRDYDAYPYGTYEENGEIYFGLQNTDERLGLKEIVYGFDFGDVRKAYPQKLLEKGVSFEDEVREKVVTVFIASDGEVTVRDDGTNEVFVPLRTFWFAWAAFHPDTLIYTK